MSVTLSPPPGEHYIPAAEVCQRFAIHPPRLRRWLRKRNIAATKISGRWFISESALAQIDARARASDGGAE